MSDETQHVIDWGSADETDATYVQISPKLGDVVIAFCHAPSLFGWEQSEPMSLSAFQSYNKPRSTKRTVMYGRVMSAKNEDSLPNGWQNSILPIVMPPAKVGSAINTMFKDSDVDVYPYGVPIPKDEKGNPITKHGLVKIVSSGTGQTTAYQIMAVSYKGTGSPMDGMNDPELTLAEQVKLIEETSLRLYEANQAKVDTADTQEGEPDTVHPF